VTANGAVRLAMHAQEPATMSRIRRLALVSLAAQSMALTGCDSPLDHRSREDTADDSDTRPPTMGTVTLIGNPNPTVPPGSYPQIDDGRADPIDSVPRRQG